MNKPTPEEKEAGELPVIKICDFGLSHFRERSLEGNAIMPNRCGTQGYIAPEVQDKNTEVGPEIDMWAFGVMLYEWCTAYRPTAVK
jgi:serine/threonine protein kinase